MCVEFHEKIIKYFNNILIFIVYCSLPMFRLIIMFLNQEQNWIILGKIGYPFRVEYVYLKL